MYMYVYNDIHCICIYLPTLYSIYIYIYISLIAIYKVQHTHYVWYLATRINCYRTPCPGESTSGGCAAATC